MPSIWQTQWGYVAEQGIAPLLIGEWGGHNEGADHVWQLKFIEYLAAHKIGSFYWCLTPDSVDTGGLFVSLAAWSDKKGVPDHAKVAMLRDLPFTKVPGTLAALPKSTTARSAIKSPWPPPPIVTSRSPPPPLQMRPPPSRSMSCPPPWWSTSPPPPPNVLLHLQPATLVVPPPPPLSLIPTALGAASAPATLAAGGGQDSPFSRGVHRALLEGLVPLTMLACCVLSLGAAMHLFIKCLAARRHRGRERTAKGRRGTSNKRTVRKSGHHRLPTAVGV